MGYTVSKKVTYDKATSYVAGFSANNIYHCYPSFQVHINI